MGSRIRVSALVGMIVWLLGGAPALAANCGGALPCQCGDMVTVDYTMTGDLGPCLGHGLQLQRNVSLDCQGFKIVGLGNGSEQYGIYLRGDTGAELTGVTVRNCDVSGFLRGIRLRAANDNLVEDNYTHHNGEVTAHVGYGIEVTLGSKNNLLQRNTVEANADEGIHLSGTGPNQLVDNVIFNNYLEQIYVLSSHGNSLIGNTSYGTGSNSLYLKDSNDSYLEGNTFKDRTARVTGAASRNVFIDNTFVNATLQFRAYDATPNRIPTNNSVAGGSMTHTGTCLRFTRTWGNTVSDLSLACATEVLSEGTAVEPSSNTIVSVTLNPSKMSVDAYSTLSVGWWLDVHVQAQNGAPIPGARVQALDAAGSGVFDLSTDATGDIPSQVLLQYVRAGASTTTKTSHTINTTKAGYLPDSRVLQAVGDLNVTVSLAPPPAGSTSGPASFSDNFNRPNSTVLGNGWTEAQGDLFVSGGELRNGAAKGIHLAVLPGLSGATQSAAADFASVDNNPGPRFGVILRFKDPRNYYLVYRLVGGTSALRISRIVNGVERVLAQRALSNPTRGQFFRLAGRVGGTTLTLELDGISKLSVSDSTFASGSPGILLSPNVTTQAYRADNFSASVQ